MTISRESMRADDGSEARILTSLSERIGPQKFNAWFKQGTELSLDNGQLKVAVPNPFVANWIDAHYRGDIRSAAEEALGASCAVTVTIDPDLNGRTRKRQLDLQAELVHRTAEGRTRRRTPLSVPTLRHRLRGFVVGESNKLAYSAALTVARGQAPFNLLFIHGSCGVGKTHLLQGVCNDATRHGGNGHAVQVRYVTGEQFTNEFITALRKKQLPAFRERYRNLDVLAIDDVHFLSAKKATQDEFLHTFNAIEAAGKRIVMASDAQPRLLNDLNEQLVSRFVSGMVVRIETPDKATRAAILAKRAKAMNLQLDEEVLQYVASHVRGSVRELEGTLMKLTALSALESKPISLQLATDALADHLARTDSAVTLGDIEAITAAFFGITPADIHSSRRTKTVSTARKVAMFLARRHTRMSYPEIAKFMGKNHSSVVLAVQRLEKELAKSESLKWMTPVGPKGMPASEVVDLLNEQLAERP